MHISNHGIELIQKFEALRLDAYQDAKGKWTIGWGHTATARENMRITKEQAIALLREDVLAAEKIVKRAPKGVEFTQNEFDALTSFFFNLGNQPLVKPAVDFPAAWKAGDKEMIALRMLEWVYDDGEIFLGLIRRRYAERELFRGRPWGRI